MLNLNININYKKWLNTGIKAVLNTKVIMLFVLLGTIIYFGGYETAYVANVKKLGESDQQIQDKKKEYEDKKKEVDQLKQWEDELKGIETIIPDIKPGESLRVMAISESKRIFDLANGSGRDLIKFPLLPAPNDKVEIIGTKQLGDSLVSVADLVSGSAGTPDSQNQPPGPMLYLARFDYEMRLKGTYPALVDYINQVAQSKKLVVLNEIKFDKPINTEMPKESSDPDVEETGIPLEMTLMFSLYFYDPNRQTPEPAKS